MPWTQLSEMNDSADFIIQPDFEVNQVFEMAEVTTAMLFENVRTRPSPVKDSKLFAAFLPLFDVVSIDPDGLRDEPLPPSFWQFTLATGAT